MDVVTPKPVRFGPRFYVLLVAVGVATFFFHETAHWLAGVVLGYPMSFSLNGVRPLTPTTVPHATLIAAAGPLLTIAQAVAAFAILRRRPGALAFAVLLWAAVMRLVATGVSFSHPNDEMRVSDTLGLGAWTLPVLVPAALCVLVWIAGRRLRIGWRTIALCYVVMSVTSAAIVLGDQALQRPAVVSSGR